MRKWLIVALSLAWLAWELVAAFDDSSSTWPLTYIVVEYVPAWITLPATLLLAVWLPWHFYTTYREKRTANPAVVSRGLATSREALMTVPTPPPTQTRHPWRATLRTAVAAGVASLPLLPVVAETAHITGVPVVARVLVVAAAVTRVLAIPGVDSWLRKYLPILAASK